MEKQYEEIEFFFGNIDDAVKKLTQYKERGKLAFLAFNGVNLYSDIDDTDSAYVKVTGQTKAEFDEAQRVRREEYKEEERKHNEAIPELTKEWITKGNEIIDKKHHKKWAKCVPIRLSDLYRGFELGACLDIVKPLNDGEDFEVAHEIIKNQGHSGMSHGLVCSMVSSFCDRGSDFVEYIKGKY